MNLKFSLYQYKNNLGGSGATPGSRLGFMSHNLVWSPPIESKMYVPETGAGTGLYLSGDELPEAFKPHSSAIRFQITKVNTDAALANDEILLATKEFFWPEGKAVFRLDQVTFPPNAVAYRHVHSGAGFRHLVAGGLEIDAGDHKQYMEPGDSWFEDINSPVKATAMAGQVSQFIRAMLLPFEFYGKPTIRILDPEDAKKPTLQKNHRIIDQVVDLR